MRSMDENPYGLSHNRKMMPITSRAEQSTPDKRGFVPFFDPTEYENLNEISDIKEADNSNVFGDTSLNDVEILKKL